MARGKKSIPVAEPIIISTRYYWTGVMYAFLDIIIKEIVVMIPVKHHKELTNIRKYLNKCLILLIIKFPDANSKPRAMMIISLDTMIAYLTVYCSDGTIDTTLYAVFLIDIQRWSSHDIFMLRNIHMIDWRYFNEVFTPFILIYYLRNYAGICVDTSRKGIESKYLYSYQYSSHDIWIKLAIDHIIGHHDRWSLNYK